MEIEALLSLFKKPFTVKYPFEPSPPPDGFRGRPEFTDQCVGCGACAAVCPPKAITMMDTEETRIVRVDHGSCIFCGKCQEVCPWEGIELTTKFELATFDKSEIYDEIEHDLILCEDCKTVITTRKHMEEIRKKIEEIGLIDKDRAHSEKLCPSCKRHYFAREVKETMSTST